MSTDVIPSKWQWAIIDDLCDDVQYGYTAKAQEKVIGPKYLRITDIQNDSVNWEKVPYCKIKDDKIKKYLLNPGDIVFARTGATVGKSYLIPENIPKSIFASYLIRLIPSKFINNKYISYFFRSHFYWNQIYEGQIGIGQPNVNASKLKNIRLPIPPFHEQVRIVSKFEELFSRLNQGAKALQQTKQQLEQYWQSILFSAYSGRLSEKWRKENGKGFNDYSTKPLNANYWYLPDSWKWLPFNIIAKINPRLPYDLEDDTLVSFIPMSRVEEETGVVDLSEKRRYKEVKKGYKRFINGDIIFAKITPCMENGKIAIPINLTNNVGIGSTEFHVIRMRDNIYVNKFYFYYLLQKWFRQYAEQHFTGTVGHRRVPTDFMKNVYVPVTSHTEQRVIVNLLENIESIIDSNKWELTTSLNKCYFLKQSILKRAFSGSLVSQNPNDEPVSVLLERVKVEKECAQVV